MSKITTKLIVTKKNEKYDRKSENEYSKADIMMDYIINLILKLKRCNKFIYNNKDVYNSKNKKDK